MHYKDQLAYYKDFPKAGITFVDVIPLTMDKEALEGITRDLAKIITTPNLAAVEARGFLFAPGLMFIDSTVQAVIPIRKKGKLPFAEEDLVRVPITKEYGEDIVEYRLSDIGRGVPTGDVFELSLFDDILATGGTALGIAKALNESKVVVDGKEYKVHVKEFIFVIEIEGLGGKELLEEVAPVRSLLQVTE